MKKKTLYIMRHGETEYNAKSILQGGGVDAPLSEKGKNDAKKLAPNLKDLGIQWIACSSLLRAQQTADIMNKQIGEVSIDYYDNLQELNFGEWEKQPIDMNWANFRRNFYHRNMSPPKGETRREFFERLQNVIQEIVNGIDVDTILIVCHKMVMRILISEWFQQITHEEIHSIELPNLALYRFEIEYSKDKFLTKNYKHITF